MKYPFLVQYRGREIILVTAETDGNCSPIIAGARDGVVGYCDRDFAKDGFNEDYRLYHGKIKVEYKCPPFPFLVKSRRTNTVYFVNEYTNGKCSPALNCNGYTEFDFTKGMGDFEIYNEEITISNTSTKLHIIDNDIVLDFGKSVFPVVCSNNKVLHCAYYVLCTWMRPFKGTVRLKMDGDKLISTKIEEIPEYPFIVESKIGILYFVSAATDGKCSPAIDGSTRFITRNFKKSGLGSFKIYNGTIILKNRKGE